MKKSLILIGAATLTLASQAFAGGNIEAGKQLVTKLNCAVCHGADFSTPAAGMNNVPRLAGQHADYLEHALNTYKRGDGENGRANAIMVGQVNPVVDGKPKALTTKEIKDIAAFLHSLPGSLVLRR